MLSFLDLKFSPSTSFSSSILSPLIALFYMGVLFAWIWVAGSSLYNKLPDSVELNGLWFRGIWVIATASYILARFIPLPALSSYLEIAETYSLGSVLLLEGIFVIGILYCAFFVAKALKSVEQDRSATLKEYAWDILLFLFFPVGVWYLQPRINKIFSDQGKEFATED